MCFEENQLVIKVNLKPLKSNTAFPYLGHTVMYNNSYWEVLYSNLRKYQRRWGMMAKDMVKTGAPVKAREMMYKAVV